jgi:hypothetical protein
MPFLRRAGRAFTLTDPKKKLLSGLCRNRTNLALMRLSITRHPLAHSLFLYKQC